MVLTFEAGENNYLYIRIYHLLCLYLQFTKTNTMTLTVSKETFMEMLKGLVASGVTFSAKEQGGDIMVTFNGGY